MSAPVTVELDPVNVAAWENIWRTKPSGSGAGIIRAADRRDERFACLVGALRATYPAETRAEPDESRGPAVGDDALPGPTSDDGPASGSADVSPADPVPYGEFPPGF